MPIILFHTIFTAPLSLRQSLRRRQVWGAWHNKAHPPVFLPITCTASFSTSHTSLLPRLLPPTHSCTSPITLCFLPASSPAHLPLLMLLQHPYCVRLHRHPVSLPPSCFLFYFFFIFYSLHLCQRSILRFNLHLDSCSSYSSLSSSPLLCVYSFPFIQFSRQPPSYSSPILLQSPLPFVYCFLSSYMFPPASVLLVLPPSASSPLSLPLRHPLAPFPFTFLGGGESISVLVIVEAPSLATSYFFAPSPPLHIYLCSLLFLTPSSSYLMEPRLLLHVVCVYC